MKDTTLVRFLSSFSTELFQICQNFIKASTWISELCNIQIVAQTLFHWPSHGTLVRDQSLIQVKYSPS